MTGDAGTGRGMDSYRRPGRTERWVWRTGLALGLAIAVTLTMGQYRQLSGALTGSRSYPARMSPCLPGRAVPTLFSPHIPPPQAGHASYNTTPPTSGPHFAFAPATGIYASPLPTGLFVHAMEHGVVVIHYTPRIGPAAIGALTTLAKRHITDVILMPNPEVARGIALTAWGRIEHLRNFSAVKITRFITLLHGRYDHGWTRHTDCPRQS